MKKYKELDNAVKDLLSELRIDEKCLQVMANGYSPDYPGAVDLKIGEVWNNPNCKIQISKVVAKKLLNSIDLNYLKKDEVLESRKNKFKKIKNKIWEK